MHGRNAVYTEGRVHSHEHSHGHAHATGNILRWSLVATTAFVLVELIAGLRAHSLALVSDAGHNFTDALALGLGLVEHAVGFADARGISQVNLEVAGALHGEFRSKRSGGFNAETQRTQR